MNNDTEKNNRKLRVPIALIWLGIGFLLVQLVHSLLSPKEPQLGSEYLKPTTVKPAELRASIYDFIISNLITEDSDKSFKISSILRCPSNRDCIYGQQVGVPTLSWSLLFLARAVDSFKQESQRASVSQMLDFIFEKWLKVINAKDEIFSLHQLFEINDLTKDPRFEYWTRDRRLALNWFIKDNVLRKDSQITLNSYLWATLARELALGNLPRLTHLVSGLDTISQKDKENFELDFLNAVKLIGFIDQDQKFGIDSTKPLLFSKDSSSEEFWPQTACWGPWAKSAILRVESNLKADQRIYYDFFFKENLAFYESLLSKLRLHNANFSTLQALLPCLHGIVEFRKIALKSPGLEKTIKDLEELYGLLMTKNVLPGWDSGDFACRSDNGFFSEIKTSDAARCGSLKSLADNSWLLFVLDPALDHLEFKVSGD